MKPSRISSVSALVLFGIILLTSTVIATPPLQPPFDRVWSHPDDVFIPFEDIPRNLQFTPRRDLDNYIGRFISICHFLDDLQEHDVDSENFGGMHEGEGNDLWRIVQTDNTQEAIKDWCIYAMFFEDVETFEDNIEAAWVYCDRYPAWEEEGGNGGYYRIHNSGWGLVAEMAYRTAYDDSQREYGLQCAQHLVDHTPEIEPDMQDALIPLTAGWAAGTLYDYAIFEENDEYLEAAIRIANEVKNWIDANHNRLNNNEIWALCGGTAMWGVLNALGQSDSTETAEWVQEPLERMDVMAGRGQWNNSWNIWYAHAWIAAWRLTDDEDYLANAVTIVDSLLSQDGDNDGGIPATIGDGDDLDQSWVTAYTGWMGLSNLFEVLPETDARLVRLVEPNVTLPHPVHGLLRFTFELLNAGAAEELEIPFSLRGEVDVDTSVMVEGWESHFLQLNRTWEPDEPGEYEFTAFTDHGDDADRSDDTLMFSFNILPVGNVIVTAENENSDPVGCVLDFYNLDLDADSIYRVMETDPQSGRVEEDLMIGNYRVEVTPDFPYSLLTIDEFEVSEGENPIELTFEHPPVLLVERDADTTSTNFAYFESALNDIRMPYRRLQTLGDVSLEGLSEGFHTLIYFTGDRDTETIPAEDRGEIATHLENGGMLFITGQNISDDLVEEAFLGEVLHSRHLIDRLSGGMVNGIEDDEVFDGFSMLLIGNQGANNQVSKSGIEPVGNGITCAEYRNVADTAAAVRWEEDSGGKGVFFAFGFEAISGQGNTVTREEVLTVIFDWFETPRKVASDRRTAPLPYSFSASVFPNPANGMVTISFNQPFLQPVRIQIFDLTGRKLRSLTNVSGTSVVWDGKNDLGLAVPSGMYLLRFNRDEGFVNSEVGMVILIR